MKMYVIVMWWLEKHLVIMLVLGISHTLQKYHYRDFVL